MNGKKPIVFGEGIVDINDIEGPLKTSDLAVEPYIVQVLSDVNTIPIMMTNVSDEEAVLHQMILR